MNGTTISKIKSLRWIFRSLFVLYTNQGIKICYKCIAQRIFAFKNFSLKHTISIPYSLFTRILWPNDKNKIISLDSFAFAFGFYALTANKRRNCVGKKEKRLGTGWKWRTLKYGIMCEFKSFEQKKMRPFNWIVLIVNGYCCWTGSKQSIHSFYALT